MSHPVARLAPSAESLPCARVCAALGSALIRARGRPAPQPPVPGTGVDRCREEEEAAFPLEKTLDRGGFRYPWVPASTPTTATGTAEKYQISRADCCQRAGGERERVHRAPLQ